MASKKSKSMSQEEILANFQKMRAEQQAIISKITELEGDKNEHRIVLDTLKGADQDRKCFRMVGGVLVERTVKDVVPALEHNLQQMSALIVKLTEQLTEKGKELMAFKQKHGIKIVDERETETKSESSDSTSSKTSTTAASQGVLVPK